MKKYVLLTMVIILTGVVVLLLYNRYRPRNIQEVIGYSQQRIEDHLNYPSKFIILDTVMPENADPRMKEVLNENRINSSKPILRYSMSGVVRIREYWLVDEGNGYYVIDARDENN